MTAPVLDLVTPGPTGSARLSDDGVYRWDLVRHLGDGPTVVWVMCNPSTADALADDATVRRVIGFSRAWGYGCAAVVNLFALRATNPAELLTHSDPIGERNDAALQMWVGQDGYLIVAAWGEIPQPLRWRLLAVHALLRRDPWRVCCLGLTQRSGMPRHPLRLAADTARRPYRIPA